MPKYWSGSRIPDPGSRGKTGLDPGSRIPNPIEKLVGDPESRIPDPKKTGRRESRSRLDPKKNWSGSFRSRIPASRSRIPNPDPESRIPNPELLAPDPTSSRRSFRFSACVSRLFSVFGSSPFVFCFASSLGFVSLRLSFRARSFQYLVQVLSSFVSRPLQPSCRCRSFRHSSCVLSFLLSAFVSVPSLASSTAFVSRSLFSAFVLRPLISPLRFRLGSFSRVLFVFVSCSSLSTFGSRTFRF